MKIIAHRCGTDRYPELTVAAARHSLAAGAAYVEMDVRFTADGVPVIHHDDTAAGLFGDPRRIAEMTLPEFLALRRDVVRYSGSAMELTQETPAQTAVFTYQP